MADELSLLTELQEISQRVCELTGLSSRWSGIVLLAPDAEFRGRKRFACDIEIDAALAQREGRWATLIHEILHSVSVGNVPAAYWEFPGWEEGVVEQLQRLFRPDILQRLDPTVTPESFEETERQHLYNEYIQSLE